MKLVNTVHSQVRRIFGEIPIVSISIAAVIACFVGNTIYTKNNPEPSDSVGASIINAVVIIVLGVTY